jgi:putative ABC transport system substrate-binding protein
MKRRHLLEMFAAAALGSGPVSLFARMPRDRPARIGLLPDLWKEWRALLHAAMHKRGWREERDYVLVVSGTAPGPDFERTARLVLGKKPDLLYVANTGYAVAAHRLAPDVPIVMVTSGYPVEAGLAESLARPGGSVTGNSAYAGVGIFGKLLELLRDAKPDLRRVGVLWSYVPPAHPRAEIEPCYQELREAADSLKIAVQIEEIAQPGRVAPALDTLRASNADALLVTVGAPLWSEAERIMQFSLDHRLPTISDFKWLGSFSPVITYAPTYDGLTEQAVDYVDRILRGAKPGDLPIQQPTKFELIVDIKTARAMGLELPRSMLLRADRVIE